MLSWVCTRCALSIRLHCMLQVPMIVMAQNMGLSLPVLWRFCFLAWLCFADMSDIWYEALGYIQKYIYFYCICTYVYIIVCLLWFASFINLHSLLYVIHTHRIWLYNLIYVEKKQPNPIVMKNRCFGASYTYTSYIYLVGGLEHLFFPYLGNFIIPTDFHIFQ